MNYFLETERLKLRSWQDQATDEQLSVNFWGNPEISRHLKPEGVFTANAAKEILRNEIKNESKYGVQFWPVFTQEEEKFIGVCGLRPYKLFDGVFEFGIYLLPEFRRLGLGSELGLATMEHVFHTLNIRSLFAGHLPQNQESSNLLKKLGFRFTHIEFYPPTEQNQPSYIMNAEDFVVL